MCLVKHFYTDSQFDHQESLVLMIVLKGGLHVAPQFTVFLLQLPLLLHEIQRMMLEQAQITMIFQHTYIMPKQYLNSNENQS